MADVSEGGIPVGLWLASWFSDEGVEGTPPFGADFAVGVLSGTPSASGILSSSTFLNSKVRLQPIGASHSQSSWNDLSARVRITAASATLASVSELLIASKRSPAKIPVITLMRWSSRFVRDSG